MTLTISIGGHSALGVTGIDEPADPNSWVRVAEGMASEELLMDELWELADLTAAEASNGSAKPPSPKPTPETPRAAEAAEPTLEAADCSEHEEPISWLRLAAKMAAEGRKKEAAMCRKTAMGLLQENR